MSHRLSHTISTWRGKPHTGLDWCMWLKTETTKFLCCAWLCCHIHAHSSCLCFSFILPLSCNCLMLSLSWYAFLRQYQLRAVKQWRQGIYLGSVTISSFPLLHFFTSLAIQALPDSSLLPTYIPWPSAVFFYLLIYCSTTFPRILSLVLLISSMTFFFFLHCSLDYIMDSRPSYINPQSNPCIP